MIARPEDLAADTLMAGVMPDAAVTVASLPWYCSQVALAPNSGAGRRTGAAVARSARGIRPAAPWHPAGHR